MVLGIINRTAWGTKLLLTAAKLPCGLYQVMSHTEGIPLLFESEWLLEATIDSPPAPTSRPIPLQPLHPYRLNP